MNLRGNCCIFTNEIPSATFVLLLKIIGIASFHINCPSCQFLAAWLNQSMSGPMFGLQRVFLKVNSKHLLTGEPKNTARPLLCPITINTVN